MVFSMEWLKFARFDWETGPAYVFLILLNPSSFEDSYLVMCSARTWRTSARSTHRVTSHPPNSLEPEIRGFIRVKFIRPPKVPSTDVNSPHFQSVEMMHFSRFT